MKTKATAKFVGTSARKIGLVAALVRGRSATQAQAALAAAGKRAADPVSRALDSAIANAENNLNTRKADLVVEAVLVGPGPTLKRFRPRAKGSASSIKKRSSHITVIVSDGQSGTRDQRLNSSKTGTSPRELESLSAGNAQSEPNAQTDSSKKLKNTKGGK